MQHFSGLDVSVAQNSICVIDEAIEAVATKTGSQTPTREEWLRKAITFNGVWNTLDKLRADCLSVLH